VIVVDASVIATALLDDEADGAAVRDRLRHTSLAAPEILDLEVLSMVRRLLANDQLTVKRADQAITDLADLRVQRAPHRPLIHRCWELRHNLSPYDASYVALAEALDTSLLTADERLARAPGPDCPIDLITSFR
jgi:predicted nucleic acid-binding protein